MAWPLTMTQGRCRDKHVILICVGNRQTVGCRSLAGVIRNKLRLIACGYPEAEDETNFSTSE